MRMKRSRISEYWLKTRCSEKDSEGGITVTYLPAVSFRAEIWPGNGKVQAEVYGEKLSYVRNLRVAGNYVITSDRSGITHYVFPEGMDFVESDGICIYVGKEANPDYKINAIKSYAHLTIEAIKL